MMMTEHLRRLRQAADAARSGFPDLLWHKVSGPGPDTIKHFGHGGFEGWNFDEKGHAELVLRATLDIPAEAQGVAISGQPLEATLGSLHPIQVIHNGHKAFSDDGPPVAAGPALFTLIPKLQAGDNGTLEMRIRIPTYHMVPWISMRFTTPTLRMKFEQLDTAWAQIRLAQVIASMPEELAAVYAASSLIPELLETRATALQQALDRITAALAPLHEKAAGISIDLIGHSHIDMNWLWTWRDTFQVIRRDVRSVLTLMDDYPEFKFSHSQPATYEVIRQNDPDLWQKLLKQIKAGRWEATTFQWVEPDCNMPSGEAHVRQMLHAVRYTRDVLGTAPTILHAPDTFGHAGNLPQLATSAGAVGYYHHRANPGQASQWPAYWWEGQDGSRLLAFSTPGYNGEITAGDLTNAAIRAYEAGHKFGLHFHGVGDHGGGPARQNLDTLRRLQRIPGLPAAACGTMIDYIRKLLGSGVALPVHRGESSTIFEGCYTTHADTKRYNRHSENLLCTADTLAVLAGLNQTAPLADAWRKTLFNQFHDILDGSAIHETYDDHRMDYEAIVADATKAIDASLSVLHRGIAPGKIAVTNPLGFDRTDVVTIKGLRGDGAVWLIGDDGHATPGQYTADGLMFTARVPALSTVAYSIDAQPTRPMPAKLDAVPRFAPTDPRAKHPPTEPTDRPFLEIETDDFLANVRPESGIIASLIDKRVGRELCGFGRRRASDYIDSARNDLCLNVLQILDELPHGMNAWQMHDVAKEQSLLRGATTKIIESGPVVCVLEVKHTIRASSITQRIYFYRNLPRIDFVTDVDWKEIGAATVGVPGLKVAFTAHLEDCNAWYETPFAAAKRPADGQEVPALRWAAVGGKNYGIALLNDCKYGHDALGCRLRLTLIRSGYDPDPVSDAGRHHVRYSLMPHAGDWRDANVVQAGAGFNQPLIGVQVTSSAGEAIAPTWKDRITLRGTAQLATLKFSDDSKGQVLRIYDSGGRGGSVRIGGLAGNVVYETNVIEDRLRRLPVSEDGLELTLKPWQVRTILIESTPSASA